MGGNPIQLKYTNDPDCVLTNPLMVHGLLLSLYLKLTYSPTMGYYYVVN